MKARKGLTAFAVLFTIKPEAKCYSPTYTAS